MHLPFTFTIATLQAVDEARRALRLARRYRTIQLTDTPTARARAVFAGLVEACIDRLTSIAPRIASAFR